MTAVETLRRAAEELRNSWEPGDYDWDDEQQRRQFEYERRYNLAVADLLEHEAAIRHHNQKKWTIFTRNFVAESHFAAAVARAVLGGAS